MGLERKITTKDNETVCSCDGDAKCIMSCLNRLKGVLKGSSAEFGSGSIIMPYTIGEVGSEMEEKLKKGEVMLIKKQLKCMTEGFSELGEKFE